MSSAPARVVVKIALAYLLYRGSLFLRFAIRVGLAKTYKTIVGQVLQSVQLLPGVNSLIDGALDKEISILEKDLLGDGDKDAHVALPLTGFSTSDIVAKATAQTELKAHASYTGGQKWGGIYHNPDSPLTDLQNKTWALFNNSNTLYPGVFPGIRKFEAELVTMVLGIVHGHENGAVGLLSSGGTESILLAVLAYREQARARGITEPEIICGISAHPAVYKACHYFGVKLVKVEIDPVTLKLMPATVSKYINCNTVCVYASAPTFTHGVVDPVEELGALCVERGLGLHVDNCLGGFLLSFLCKLGMLNRQWDFQVPGVTSISIDLHKYGFCSKGVSVVCFRDPALRRLTYVPSVDGCEGLYVTPTLQGSRAGGVIAQAWATVLYMGENGYEKLATDMHTVTNDVKDIVRSIPELDLLVDSDAAIVPVVSNSKNINIYQVASIMEQKGWNMFTGQHPPVMSVCLGEQHLKVLGDWAKDLKDAVSMVRNNPSVKLEGTTAVYGSAAAIPDELLDSVLRSYCDTRMRVKQA